jgi:glycerol-3-phosphate dehydrogenase (NAD(P)+)
VIQKVTVIGSGSWGIALANLLATKGINIKIWSFSEEEAKILNEDREYKDKLPGVILPSNVHITTDIKEAVEFSEFVIIVVPSQTIRQNAKIIAPFIKKDSIVVCCSKGIEEGTGKLLSDVLEEELHNCKIAVISGPSHAEEVAKGIPTTVVSASRDIEVAKVVQDVFMCQGFRVYTNNDIIGVEIGAALKNIIALCAGICDGIGYGDNTKAALMTRGIAEMARLGVAIGAKKRTFAGLSGMGDLIVTCTSMHSRNRRAGILIGQGKSLKEALEEVKMVVEGVSATKAAYEMAQRLGVTMPITTEAYNILFNGNNVKQAVKDLMQREKKDEIS